MHFFGTVVDYQYIYICMQSVSFGLASPDFVLVRSSRSFNKVVSVFWIYIFG